MKTLLATLISISLAIPVLALTAEEAAKMPDGVGRIKYNADGSLLSVCIKATVPIDEILGASEGKAMARKEGELKAKESLSSWMEEEFVGATIMGNDVSIVTQSAQDGKGKKIEATAEQTKTMSERKATVTKSLLKGIKSIFSDILPAAKTGDKAEYTVIMVLDTKDVAAALKAAESMAQKADLSGDKQSDDTSGINTDTTSKVSAETKASVDADQY